jgi:hypothetical protein
MDEDRKEELNRELIELLNELRVVLPGVQVLFAFLLAVPFSNGWRRITHLQRDVFFACVLCTTASTILLIAPSAYHRLRWRAHDKEHMLEVANRLAIGGMALLAVATSIAVFLITDILFRAVWAGLVTGLTAAAFAWFWYGLPLLRNVPEG